MFAHAGLNVLVLLVERSPNRVSHELRNKPLAVFAAASLGVEVQNSRNRTSRGSTAPVPLDISTFIDGQTGARPLVLIFISKPSFTPIHPHGNYKFAELSFRN